MTYEERDEKSGAPHCDPSVLHPPTVCRYCDMYPDWQAMRERARINYTGENDPDKAPCPSLYFRSAQRRDQWGGNRAVPHGQQPPPMWTWGMSRPADDDDPPRRRRWWRGA